MPDSSLCPVCAGESVFFLEARDEMFDTPGVYSYRRCASCGFAWLSNPPPSLESHYPPGYGGHWEARMPLVDVKRPLKMIRSRIALRRGLLWHPLTRQPFWYGWFAGTGLALDSAICDIGCGNGYYLVQLWREGFSNLRGFDAYIDNDIRYRNRVLVQKLDLHDVTGTFDLVMLHHSLEHFRDQQVAMRHVRSLVCTGGSVLVRVPLIDSWAACHFGSSWYQLDAPRHLALHSRLSLALLAEATGFRVRLVVDDSTDHDLASSSEYAGRRKESGSPGNLLKSSANGGEIRSPISAGELNRIHLGDQACFLLEAK